MTPKARYFWPFLFVVCSTDCTTKDLVVEHLESSSVPYPVIDSFVRLTLVHNPGTAIGFDLRPYVGEWTRPMLIVSMMVILVALARVYAHTAPRARLVAAALGLVCGGAIGNLLDRLRFPLGVVDFIDVGVGAHRFWTFNIADAGITVGALALAIVFSREETAPSSSQAV